MEKSDGRVSIEGMNAWTDEDLNPRTLDSREKAAVGDIARVVFQYAVRCRLGYHDSVATIVFDALAHVRRDRWPLVLAHAAARHPEDTQMRTLLEDAGADLTLVNRIVEAGATRRVYKVRRQVTRRRARPWTTQTAV